MLTNPIGLAITALVATLWYLWDNWDKVKAIFTQSWDVFTSVISGNIDHLVDKLRNLTKAGRTCRPAGCSTARLGDPGGAGALLGPGDAPTAPPAMDTRKPVTASAAGAGRGGINPISIGNLNVYPARAWTRWPWPSTRAEIDRYNREQAAAAAPACATGTEGDPHHDDGLRPPVFGLDTLAYQELERASEWRHPTNSRVGARPAAQFLGPGPETITLTGLLAPLFKGSSKSLDLLREMANTGQAWPWWPAAAGSMAPTSSPPCARWRTTTWRTAPPPASSSRRACSGWTTTPPTSWAPPPAPTWRADRIQ
jgi:hypothetical protein